MSNKSTRLYTTVTPELGEAVEREAVRLRITVPDFLRQIIADAVAPAPRSPVVALPQAHREAA